jgi:isopenicillin-N epimerase
MDRQNSNSKFLSSGSLGTISPDSVDWKEVRDHFVLRDDMIYMNCGTEGSMPRPILEQYRNYNLDWAKSPSYYFFDHQKLGARNFQEANRAAIGQFIGAKSDDICLTNNTTMGLAIALLGLPLMQNDVILTSDQEHWALISPLTFLKKRGITTDYVELDVPLKTGRSVVEAFESKITKRTRVIAVSHITWSTGARLPIRKLCKLARDNKIITVIDGAHALGALALNMTELGCDFYATSGHKWLNGPPGTGVLYIRKAKPNPHKLAPILAEAIPDIGKQPISAQLQTRGCNNTAGFAAMVDAASFADELGRDVIERRILELSAYTKRRVIEVWGPAALLSPPPDRPALGSGLISFVPLRDPSVARNPDFINAVVNTLWRESRIYVRSVPIPTRIPPLRSAIRVSTNIFNSYSEIDRLIDETSRIAA